MSEPYNFKSIESLYQEISDSRETLGGRIIIMLYSVKRFLGKIVKFPYYVKWWYQRARRGYSDRDAWNGDTHIARQLAGIMLWTVNHGKSVSMSYCDDYNNFEYEDIEKRRNEDYMKHIPIFQEYAKNGIAHNQKWKDNIGGVLDEEMKQSLLWLVDHFSELWD